MKDTESVLIISPSDRAASEICDFLGEREQLSPVISVSSFTEAKAPLSQMYFDIIIINPSSSGEEKGADFARRAAERFSKSGVILLCGKDNFDSICDETENEGVLVLQKPINKNLLDGGIRLIRAVKKKLCRYEDKTSDLQAKVEEMKLVNRAKSILMAQFKMDEDAAHRYIEKQSMDRCITRTALAKNIINTYES